MVGKVEVRLEGKYKDLFEWFERELKTVCGIDVFSYPFDKEKGYVIIKENTVEILVIKTEKLSQMTGVLREFIGSPNIELSDSNVRKEKEYAHIYEQVKKKIKFSKEYV